MTAPSVLSPSFKPSDNFWNSDVWLRHFVRQHTNDEARWYMTDKWVNLGRQAATELNDLSMKADKNPPQLRKRNFYGDDIDQIDFHPAYERMTQIALESDMFRVKWLPELRQQFDAQTHLLGFISGYLFAMSESGLYCPLCMTDGAARLIDRYCTPEDKNRLLPHIFTDRAETLYTGAMFLTEKVGGSDVGANTLQALPSKKYNGYYELYGEKWFCSNASAQIAFVLARTNPEIQGTRGLSIFLVEPTRPNNSKNNREIVRLKDKLGTRSMASAECLFNGTLGKLVGKEGEGFKIMTDMINLSRLYNSVAALASMRRALVEAYQFLSYRTSFGKQALEHALIRQKMHELSSIVLADFYLTFRAISTLDAADKGDSRAANLIRLLTPMVKKATAEHCVYVIRECMELMGGMGYIEDGPMPKIMRDAMVLPIWEGAGNIMVLDMMRAAQKGKGLAILAQEISAGLKKSNIADHAQTSLQQTLDLLKQSTEQPQDIAETTAKFAFQRLLNLYYIALLSEYTDSESQQWTQHALDYWVNDMFYAPQQATTPFSAPISRVHIEQLVGWL